MRKILFLIIILFTIQTLSAQEKKGFPFFTASLNSTFAINEEYTLQDDDQPLFVPSAILLRVGFGYQFNRRWAAGLHAGFDHHFSYGINAIPTYGSLRYNITENDGDAFFVEARYGKMWRPSPEFGDGNYYGVGVGMTIFGGDRSRGTLHLDFHRKKIAGFENGSLDSVSLGIGIILF